MQHHSTIRARHLALMVVGIAAVVFAWWQVTAPARDLHIRHDVAGSSGTLPVTVVAPRRAEPEPASETETETPRPVVLVAHGFGSSRRMMLGYAYTLAYEGFAVVLWDFGGHGANPGALDDSRDVLQRDIDSVLSYLQELAFVDPARVAILGHSMGSGAAMHAGIRLPDTFAAVVAVSPTDAPVTSEVPRNLLLQAGSWETRFLDNAEALLERAGGERIAPGDVEAGKARALVEVPAAEHITILFRELSQNSAHTWIDASLNGSPLPAPASLGTKHGYVDRRALWYAIHFVGWLLLGYGVAPALRTHVRPQAGRGRKGLPALHARRWWIAMLAAPFVATGAIFGLGELVEIRTVGGMLVGGVVALWFGLYGIVWLAVGSRPALPSLRSAVMGVGVFAFLWVAAGLMTHYLALQWFLIPARLVRWVPASALTIPWLLAAGYAQSGAHLRLRVAVYLGQTLPIVAALMLAGISVPGLFIVVLLVPALPLVFLAMALTCPIIDDPWAYAVGNALFFGWLLAALFPLAA